MQTRSAHSRRSVNAELLRAPHALSAAFLHLTPVPKPTSVLSNTLMTTLFEKLTELMLMDTERYSPQKSLLLKRMAANVSFFSQSD